MPHAFPRLLAAVAAAALLAACGGGAASLPSGTGVQTAGAPAASAARALADHGKAAGAELSASPSSLEFTADEVAAFAPQTVVISAQSDRKLTVSIAGSGNCPKVSPPVLQPRHAEDDGRDDHGAKTGVITVTPFGFGPASCTITVAPAHGDGDADDDGHRDAGAGLTIAVKIDAPAATPAPITR